MGTVRVWLLCNVAKNAFFHRYTFLGPHVLHSDDPLNFPHVPSRPQFQPEMVEGTELTAGILTDLQDDAAGLLLGQER